MFRRALNNLICKAISHSPPNREVRIAISQQGDQALITVENGGNHIDEKHLRHLFDRFYRIDPSRGSRQGEGVGPGLAIVKSIADLHGGTIDVTSSPDKTGFILQVPLGNTIDPATK